MPKTTKTKPTESTASSWWKSRGEILSKKTESKAKKPKSVRTKKAEKAQKGNAYICEICGCEMECISDSAGNLICCEEPMCLVI